MLPTAATPSGEAVLDHETGLVWERSRTIQILSWFTANFVCGNATTGSRSGWRLPALSEIKSLLDPGSPDTIKMPPGHPFVGIALEPYWSATDGDLAGYAKLASLSDPTFAPQYLKTNTTTPVNFICVRGPR